jgi:hypothetical protein
VIFRDGKYYMFFYNEASEYKELYFATSTDGITFTIENGGKAVLTATSVYDIAWSNDYQGYFMVVETTVNNKKDILFYFSQDAITWTFNSKNNPSNSVYIDPDVELNGGVSLLKNADGTISGDTIRVAYVGTHKTQGHGIFMTALNISKSIADSDTLIQIGKSTSTVVECGAMDADNNGKLTSLDFTAFLQVYGKTCIDSAPKSGCKGKDSNEDGKVDVVDLASFAGRYNKASCTN